MPPESERFIFSTPLDPLRRDELILLLVNFIRPSLAMQKKGWEIHLEWILSNDTHLLKKLAKQFDALSFDSLMEVFSTISHIDKTNFYQDNFLPCMVLNKNDKKASCMQFNVLHLLSFWIKDFLLSCPIMFDVHAI